MIDQFRKIIIKKDLRDLSILIFLLVFVNILELFSITAIPVFLSSIYDQELFLNLLSKFKLTKIKEFLSVENDEMIVIGAILILVIFLIKNIILTIVIYFRINVIKNIRQSFKSRVLRSNLRKNYLNFVSKNSAVHVREVNTDCVNASVVIFSYTNLFKEAILLILIFISLAIYDLKTSLILIIFLSIFVSIYYLATKKTLKKNAEIIKKSLSNLIKSVNEIYGSIKDITIYNSKEKVSNDFDRIQKELESKVLINNFITSVPRMYLEVISVASIMFVIIFFIKFNFNSSSSELLFSLSFFAMLMIRTLPSFTAIAQSLAMLKNNKTFFFSVVKNIDEHEIINEGNNKEIIAQKSEKNIEFIKKINLKEISFSYDGKNKILDNLNLQISKGDKIAIMGKSGSGKSTLMNMILALIRPNKGEISVDNFQFSKKNNLLQWQNLIGYVSQENYLLDDTIEENIIFSSQKKYNLDNLNKILKMVEINDLVENLPNKLQTVVGDRGHMLSAGQKQRINIARAIYRNPQILIFDEGTNSLDLKNENKIFKNIFENFPNLTLILVSHKLETIKNCNKFFLMENKKITNLSYEDLVQNQKKF